MPDDPLRLCPHGCLLHEGHSFCPWHGKPLGGSLVGFELDSYKIKKVLSAAGGFGTVYYAENDVGGLQAAIKVLKPPGCYDRAASHGLIDEVRTMFEKLRDCPRSARVLNASTRPWPHITMAFINGGSLHGLLQEVRGTPGSRRAIAPALARQLVVDVAEALDYAHRKGVVHRDLKPHNVLLQKDEEGVTRGVVVDWGIAIGGGGSASAPVVGSGKGEEATTSLVVDAAVDKGLVEKATSFTVKYAPGEFHALAARAFDPSASSEDIEKGLRDPRGDVYQFGLVAHETLTGSYPFDTSDYVEGMPVADYWREKHSHHPPTDIQRAARAAGVKVPRRFASAIRKCLEKDPAARFASGQELHSYLTHKPPVWQTVAASVALVATILIVWLATRPDPSGGDITNIWGKWRQSPAVKDLYLEVVAGGVAVGGRKKDVGVLWVPTLEVLAGGKDGQSFDYSPPPLEDTRITRLSLQRWRYAVEPPVARPTDASRVEDWDGERAVGLVSFVDSTYTVHFSALAKALLDEAKASGGGGESYLFALDASTLDASGAENLLTQFFEVRVDPRKPLLAVRSVAFEQGGVRHVFDGASLSTSEPNRLVVPPAAAAGKPWDLVVNLTVHGENLTVGDGVTAVGAGDAPGVYVAVDGLLNERRLGFEIPPGEEKGLAVNLSDLCRADGRQGPDPRPEGVPVTVSFRAHNKAQSSAGPATKSPLKLDLVLDSGPMLAPVDPSSHVRRHRGVAAFDVEWGEERSLESACEVAFSVLDSCVETPEKPELPEWSLLTTLAAPFAAGQGRRRSLAVPVPLDAALTKPLAAGNSPAQKTLVVYARERPRSAEHPRGARYPDGAGGAYGVVAVARLCVAPDKDPSPEDLGFRMTFVAGSTVQLENRSLVFAAGAHRWHAAKPERVPQFLDAGCPALALTDPVAQLAWWDAEKKQKLATGARLDVGRLGVSHEKADRRKLWLAVETNWGKTIDVPVEIVYDPSLPRRPRDLMLSLDGGAPVALGGPHDFAATSETSLALWASPEAEDLVDKARLEGVGPDGPVLVDGEARPGTAAAFAFDVFQRGLAREGSYALKLTFEDRCGNKQEHPIPRLRVHMAPPRFDLGAGLDCGRSDVQAVPEVAGECTLAVTCEHPCGLSDLVVKRGGGQVSFASVRGWRADPAGGGEKLGVEVNVEPGGARVNLRFLKIGEAVETESIAVSARSWIQGAAAECVLKVRRAPEEPPAEVPDWLGLPWVRIAKPGEYDFYVTKYEVPAWFVRGPGTPPVGGGTEADWLPATGMKPEDVVLFLKKIGSVYIPTHEEWKRIPTIAEITAHTPEKLPGGLDSGQLAKSLRAEIVCKDGVRKSGKAVRVNRDEGAGIWSAHFRGVAHLLGNVAELVEEEPGKYSFVGGSFAHTFADCIGMTPAFLGRGLDKIGFRLVVYHKAPRGAQRRENAEFRKVVDAAKRRPAEGGEKPRPARPAGG